MSMASRGFEEIGVVTQMGTVTLPRRYYVCDYGHGGYAPFDRLLGLHNHASKGIQDWICYTAAKEAFAGAAETVAVFSDVALSHATVQEIAEWHGQQLDVAQKALTERVFDFSARPPEPAGPDTLYVEADGAFVPKRAKDTWSECRVGVIFEVEGQEEDRRPVNVSYVAAVGPLEDFGPLLYAKAYMRGADTARKLVFLADGAPGLWNLADEHFPHAVHILDFYHASEHIHSARLLRWSDSDEEGKAWATVQARRLKAGAWDNFVDGFDDLHPKGILQCDDWKKALAYFQKRRDHMHYDRYLAMGLYIGSGMVESGCKLVVTQRMKLVGAHWGDPGAHYMVNLRADFLNGAFRPAWIARLAA
jgi:hypothetical protein